MGATFSQFFPPSPALTEANLPSQAGKVFIVTGGASGVGLELVRMLYYAGATVYVAGRSEVNARGAIDSIRASTSPLPSTDTPEARLEFLQLDLSDLPSIKPAAEAFLKRETRLDVLWNNAGVSLKPAGIASAAEHQLQMTTNCLGPWLFTRLLLPLLRSTAAGAAPGAVRVVWSSSFVVDLAAPTGGFAMADVTGPPKGPNDSYTHSKTGNWFLAAELAREVRPQGVLSLTQNPGNLQTNLLRHTPWWFRAMVRPILYPAKMGAYTELFAGLAEEITMDARGVYVIPWGRVHPSPRRDLTNALKSKDEGGTGRANEFRGWCNGQVAEFL